LDRLCRFWIAGVVKKSFPSGFSKGILFYAGIEVKGELRAIVEGGKFAQEVGILDLRVRYFFYQYRVLAVVVQHGGRGVDLCRGNARIC